MSDTIRSMILNFHNDARRRVAKGQEPNNVGMLNPAKNMYKLEWDCTMEQQAQDAIANCPSGLGSWSNMAQNMMTWTGSGGFSNPSVQVNSSLNSWWGSAKKNGVTDADNKYTTSALYHFANSILVLISKNPSLALQMVFSETSKIGCAYKVCDGTKLTFTCLYNGLSVLCFITDNYSGYYTNVPMWETGTACSTGSDCTTFSNSGCDNGLCIKGAPVPGMFSILKGDIIRADRLIRGSSQNQVFTRNCKRCNLYIDLDKGLSCVAVSVLVIVLRPYPTTLKESFVAPVQFPSFHYQDIFTETNNKCSSNSGMTDSVRQKFLDLHNQYRSSLARGLEPDALGGNAPKAAKMLKMVYDCSVEASALKHASKCVYQHSANTERPGLGENLYKTSALNFDKVKAAAQSSQMWWSELKEYGVGPSNNLTLALWNRPDTQIGHYTQMAWETSYRLGCAVAHCSSFTYAVCQYGPAGNYLNSLIYTIGNPCTSDAGCPGSYTCNISEGLCNVV
ncbi:unnamed protein product [Haemonchus placei]|uniref:SCP domain-containing protein n=1 Tax=Haemonchus placei TaxID=6290 RepID=A0A0N4VSH2_HAEPC|nr:unnamed protein product [Haemonchus placei]